MEVSMKSMAISVFKAHALQVIDTVAKDHMSVLITKHGKPLAEVIPYSAEKKPVPGKLASMLRFEKDIVAPLGGSLWEAAQ
jgi:prevent-host-death family protein